MRRDQMRSHVCLYWWKKKRHNEISLNKLHISFRHVCSSAFHSLAARFDHMRQNAYLVCAREDWHLPSKCVVCAFFIFHFVTCATWIAPNTAKYVFRKYLVLQTSHSGLVCSSALRNAWLHFMQLRTSWHCVIYHRQMWESCSPEYESRIKIHACWCGARFWSQELLE